MRLALSALAPLALCACLEAQPTPDIAVRRSAEFNIETLLDGLSIPWAVRVLPSGDYLVTERAGRLLYVPQKPSGAENTLLHALAVRGLPSDVLSAGQGGLFDIMPGPDFTENGTLFISYAYGSSAMNGTAIYKARLKDGELLDGRVLYKSQPRADTVSHFGGRMALLPDDTLLLSLGDGFAYREGAQVPTSTLGKIIRLDLNGGIPPDNPLADEVSALPEIYSLGHRNVQGLFFDSQTGNLWASEHGPRGGDELNLIKAGLNYGWPIATTGRDYNGARISPYDHYPPDKFPSVESFIYDWVPSIAPSGMIIYRGDLFSAWRGDALIAALSGTSLRRIDLNDTESLVEESLLSDMGLRFRDVAEDKDGAILLLGEQDGFGRLLKLRPRAQIENGTENGTQKKTKKNAKTKDKIEKHD